MSPPEPLGLDHPVEHVLQAYMDLASRHDEPYSATLIDEARQSVRQQPAERKGLVDPALLGAAEQLLESAWRVGYVAGRRHEAEDRQHDHTKCNGCLHLGHLPHDPSTCADFDGDGEHCVIEHAPFDDGPVGYPAERPSVIECSNCGGIGEHRDYCVHHSDVQRRLRS